MIGTLAAGALPSMTNSGPISAPAGPATSGPAYSGGTQGNISINTGGRGGVPWWGWALMAAGAGAGVLWFAKGRA